MKRALTLFIVLALALFVISGCGDSCEKPYIQVGDSCCLDMNDNSICDDEEEIPEEEEIVPIEEPEVEEEEEVVEEQVIEEPEVEEEDDVVIITEPEEINETEEEVEEGPEVVEEAEEEETEDLSAMGKHPMYVTVFDIKDGNAALIITPNDKVVMINVGPKGIADLLGYNLRHEKKLSKIDHVLFTDLEDDNAGAIQELSEKFEIGHTYDNGVTGTSSTIRMYTETVANKGIQREVLNADKEIYVDPSIKVESFVVYDSAKKIKGKTDKILYKITFRDFSMLFTGDCKTDTCENYVLEADLDSDVVTIPAHGSTKASSAEFISAVDAQVAVLQNGADAGLGVVNAYKDSGATVYDTYKEKENIELTSTGSTFTFNVK
ncbi:hypothetical protein HN419_04475 [Candidatus Woesearchaeota archaeon]|jgi:beta-lactamase superfamily II metal-dependent hydrolase|nr:hypothetical protein [Candidatus Woesearchaeota archaeon]MBT3537866.1 hypothetical protein [Candidatus Woesearchaeota archaeon]MBT4697997.1 hypothetical protein [Candidatus Woesearchaeota archaeon]MBT7105535.1 hypothetical protein [Candidatus Woesearchaeota archaeon]MBT7931465.1 hypothetical protein [Candidatus Woesearchaeota archaeon]